MFAFWNPTKKYKQNFRFLVEKEISNLPSMNNSFIDYIGNIGKEASVKIISDMQIKLLKIIEIILK